MKVPPPFEHSKTVLDHLDSRLSLVRFNHYFKTVNHSIAEKYMK